MVHFAWAGIDEMDQVSGDGNAELFDDGAIDIVFACHNGGELVLPAKRQTSSTACYSCTPTLIVFGHILEWQR